MKVLITAIRCQNGCWEVEDEEGVWGYDVETGEQKRMEREDTPEGLRRRMGDSLCHVCGKGPLLASMVSLP